MDNFTLLLKKNFLEFRRTKKWFVYILVFVIVTVFSVISARVLPELLNSVLAESGLGSLFEYEVSVADSYVQFIANMSEIAWLLIVIMFSSSLIKEKTSGTYYMLKSNGVSETKIVMAHFVSKLILITISYIASLIVFIPLNLILFKQYTGLRGVASLSIVYMLLIFGLCLALFISSIVKSTKQGVVVSIVSYFVLTLLITMPYIDVFVPMNGINLASDVIINDEIELNDYLINIPLTLMMMVSCLLGSIYCFKNKIDNRK